MGKHLLTIHGHKVYCEDDRAFHGVKHLAYEIDETACRELFKQAEDGQQVDFEDDDRRRYALVDGENGAFTVVTHDKPSTWF